jgi:hypothetical protein
MIQTLIWGNHILWFENCWVYKHNASKAGGWQPCTVTSEIWSVRSGSCAERVALKAKRTLRVRAIGLWTTFFERFRRAPQNSATH